MPSCPTKLSFDVHSLLLFRLRRGIEFLHDGAFAIAVEFAIEAVVDGGQSDVRFSVLGRFLDDGFEVAARGFEFVFAKRDGSELVARGEIVGAHL